jgi:hypothetical protein
MSSAFDRCGHSRRLYDPSKEACWGSCRMQALSPRTLRSVGLVTLAVVFFLAGTGFLLDSLLEGYWRIGTYGFLVIPGLMASCLGMPIFLRAFWAHVILGSPVILYSGGRFHYLREGQLSVAATAVQEVEALEEGCFGFIRFVGFGGEELQKYPLALSSVDGPTVAQRANLIIRDQKYHLATR